MKKRASSPRSQASAQGRGHVGLAGADVAHEDQVLAPVEERQGQQALAVDALHEAGGHVAPDRRLAERPEPGDQRRHERERVAHGGSLP